MPKPSKPALKVARKWAYRVKGVPENQAQIITAGGNFHGRTISIISFSDDPVATADYGPYTPGFVGVKYGDLEALERRDHAEYRGDPARADPG